MERKGRESDSQSPSELEGEAQQDFSFIVLPSETKLPIPDFPFVVGGGFMVHWRGVRLDKRSRD